MAWEPKVGEIQHFTRETCNIMPIIQNKIVFILHFTSDRKSQWKISLI